MAEHQSLVLQEPEKLCERDCTARIVFDHLQVLEAIASLTWESLASFQSAKTHRVESSLVATQPGVVIRALSSAATMSGGDPCIVKIADADRTKALTM
jgi:hypothetical protein